MCEPRGVAKIISLSWPYKDVKNFKQMRCCWSFFRKNTDFIYPPRAGMNCIFVKFRWLFWNVWLHQTTWKASHILACVCVECKQRCVLQFAAWLTFLRQNKYTGTVLVQPSGGTERNSKKYCSFIHTEMTAIYLFICIRSRRGLVSEVLTSSHKLADCIVSSYLTKDAYAHVKCWFADCLTMTTRKWCQIHT